VSTFSDRIKWLHQPDAQVAFDGATSAQYKDYGAVKEIPLTAIGIYPGVVGYDDNPLIAADGAPISSTGPGQWSQIYRAGRY